MACNTKQVCALASDSRSYRSIVVGPSDNLGHRFTNRANRANRANRLSTPAAGIFPAQTQGPFPKSKFPTVKAKAKFVGVKSRNAPNLKHRTIGELNQADTVKTASGDRLWDEYTLSNLQPGQQVHVRLNSDEFDPLLQVVNGTNGRVIAENDNASDQNSRLTFKAKAGIDYQLHITSQDGTAMGQYEVETTYFTPKVMRDFSFDYGHGLVDGAAAVATATRAKGFSKVHVHGLDRVWGQESLKVPRVWEEGITGKGVTVAVIDTGLKLTHPELKGNLWRNPGEIPGNGKDDDGNGFIDDVRGWNFADNNADLSDDLDHGSHVAGIIGGNDKGHVTGIAPDVKLMPIKIIGDSSGSQENLVQGMRYAVKEGAKVINLSLGTVPGARMDDQLKRAIQFAHKKGVTIVVASGNERQLLGSTQPGEPANYVAQKSLGIVVGAVDKNHTVADFSNPTGNKRSAFVSAPGTNIFSLSSQENSRYRWRQGTSMATGYVSGVVALMLSANPTLTPLRIARILKKTAKRKIISVV